MFGFTSFTLDNKTSLWNVWEFANHNQNGPVSDCGQAFHPALESFLNLIKVLQCSFGQIKMGAEAPKEPQPLRSNPETTETVMLPSKHKTAVWGQ